MTRVNAPKMRRDIRERRIDATFSLGTVLISHGVPPESVVCLGLRPEVPSQVWYQYNICRTDVMIYDDTR